MFQQKLQLKYILVYNKCLSLNIFQKQQNYEITY